MMNRKILLVILIVLILSIGAVAIVIVNKDSKPKSSPGLPSPGLPPVTNPISSNVPSPQSNVPPPQPIQNPNGPFYLQFLTSRYYLYLNPDSDTHGTVYTTPDLSTASAFHLNSDGTLTLPNTDGSSQFMATGIDNICMVPQNLFTLTSTGANTISTNLGQAPDYYGDSSNTITQLVRFYYLGSTTAYNGNYSTTNHTGYLAVDLPVGDVPQFVSPVTPTAPSDLATWSNGGSSTPPPVAKLQLIPVSQ